MSHALASSTRGAVLVLVVVLGALADPQILSSSGRAPLQPTTCHIYVWAVDPQGQPVMLRDGSRESGGRHDQVVGNTHMEALEQLADELLHQYEINDTLPDGVAPNGTLSLASKRTGATVRAPSRLATRQP